jgi:hypothetical protein
MAEGSNTLACRIGRRNTWELMRERLERHPVAVLTGLYLFCVATFLVTIPLPRIDHQLVGSDGTYYYSYLPTLLFDRDLDFSNQYAKLLPENLGVPPQLSQTGRLQNKWAVGSAILWIPFFLIGHLLALLLKAAGYPIALDGIGYIYQAPTLLGSITYGFAGVLLVYSSCRRFYSKPASACAAILIWLATNIIYYMIAEPSMSHACSFFAVALFLELWLRFRPTPAFHQWIFLGMSGGLIASVRFQDSTWLALPFLEALLSMRTHGRSGLRRQLKGFFAFGATAFVVFIPQMAVWTSLNGSPVRISYPHSSRYFHWLAPESLAVLFSLRHGLYTWHPVLFLATIGLALLYRKDRRLAGLLAIMFATQLYIVGAWIGWAGGHSFGSRMLISSFPALAIGLAAVTDWAAEHKAFESFAVVSIGLIAWNALFFAQYRLGYISKMHAITFQQLTLGKLLMLRDMIGHIRALL